MKALLLSRYTHRSTSWFRSYQFIPYLRRNGIEVEPAPLLGPYYLDDLFAGRRVNVAKVFVDYVRRLRRLVSLRGFDLLWFEYEVFPWLPHWVEAVAAESRLPYLADYDDAWFHRYDEHPSRLVRRALAGKIDWIMRHAAVVVAGNDYTAARALKAGARRVERIPTVVDLDRYPVAPQPNNPVFTIGWLGTPSSASSLQDRDFRSALQAFCADTGARLVLVGPGPIELPGIPVEVRPWSAETEAQEIQRFDVGVMPLADGPFQRGKCSLKLIQYMACGRPVVASAVGFNRQLLVHGHSGFLATGRDGWLEALHRLRDDRALRKSVGFAGRRLVEASYSVDSQVSKLAALLRFAGGSAARLDSALANA